MTFDEVVLHQSGVISRAQALACGVSARTVARRVSSGAWQAIFPGVYLVGGHRRSPRAEIMAAALWGGRRATLAGPSAAYWHGFLDRWTHRLDLVVPRASHRKRPSGISLRRRDLLPEDRVVVRGVGVTAPALTVLQTLPFLTDATAFLDRALQRHVAFDDLHDAYCRNAGAWGMAAAGRLLVVCAQRADSGAERRFLSMLRRADLGHFVRGLPFGMGYEIDIAFPDAMVAIEFDGWAWHSDVVRFRNDRRKGNLLANAGWTVLRFTWDDLAYRPGTVIDQIRVALARAGDRRSGTR